MKKYVLKERKIPFDETMDVIVAGGGPAGCAAAVAAARAGAKTLLLESTGMLGGMGTAGLVPWFCGYDDREKIIARGIAEHVRSSLLKGMPHMRQAADKNPLIGPAIDPELLKRIYDDMVCGSGAKILFHSLLCGVESSEDGTVEAVIVADKRGLSACRASVYVDCTGDGDLAAQAGAEYEKGDASGAMQPATHCFVLSNVNEKLLGDGPDIHFYDPASPVWKAVKSPDYPLIVDLHSCYIKIAPGVFGFNTGHVYHVDNTDPASVTRGLIEGRRMASQYREAFAKFHPAFSSSSLVATGSLLGARETRRIKGDYTLSIDDYLEKRSFPDEICRNAYGIDVHKSDGNGIDLSDKSVEELIADFKKRNTVETRALNPGESFGVPYRCLSPAGLRNVLTAGRCISTDRSVNGSTRIMACCLNTGEAAGAAAALAALKDGDVRAVDTEELKGWLRQHGAYLP